MKFFIASHDYISSPEPRQCVFIKYLPGRKKNNYILVSITPPLPKAILNVQTDITQLVLSLCDDNQSLTDIGKDIILADILSAPLSDDRAFDENATVRIGVGSLHATIEDARRFSPLDHE